jgi:hypothetical protein
VEFNDVYGDFRGVALAWSSAGKEEKQSPVSRRSGYLILLYRCNTHESSTTSAPVVLTHIEIDIKEIFMVLSDHRIVLLQFSLVEKSVQFYFSFRNSSRAKISL